MAGCTRRHASSHSLLVHRAFMTRFVALLSLGVLFACGNAGPAVVAGPTPDYRSEPFLDTLETRTFRWFWETTNPQNGLVPDRWPTKSFSSVAAIGFGLTAYVVGAERGYVPRADARTRVRTTLDVLYHAPQTAHPTGVAGHKGFSYQ